MAFELPDLPYKHNALEPHIDAETMRIHHGKHHNAYVTKLNDAIKGMPDLEAKTIGALVADLNSIPEKTRMAVRNNGGGHFNHTLFWATMAPKAGGKPAGELAAAIKESFVSFDNFKEDFSNVAWRLALLESLFGRDLEPSQFHEVLRMLLEQRRWLDLPVRPIERAVLELLRRSHPSMDDFASLYRKG